MGEPPERRRRSGSTIALPRAPQARTPPSQNTLAGLGAFGARDLRLRAFRSLRSLRSGSVPSSPGRRSIVNFKIQTNKFPPLLRNWLLKPRQRRNATSEGRGNLFDGLGQRTW